MGKGNKIHKHMWFDNQCFISDSVPFTGKHILLISRLINIYRSISCFHVTQGVTLQNYICTVFKWVVERNSLRVFICDKGSWPYS